MTVSTAATRFTVNGVAVEVDAPGGRRLLDVLRVDLGLTGSKEGCGEGECGSCSVLVDGRVVPSCLVPLCQADGRRIVTVEGLAIDGRLDPLQATMLEAGGVQCGICTPGMVVAGRAFLDEARPTGDGTPPTDAAIREAIAGDLCRCTGYTRIVEAIRRAAVARAAAAGNSPAAGYSPAADPGSGVPFPIAWPPPLPRTPARWNGPAPATISPAALDAALAALAAGGVRPIAGGTDLMVQLAHEAAPAGTVLLDLSGLDELRAIRLEPKDGGPVTGAPAGAAASAVDPVPGRPESLLVGALATYADLRSSPLVAEHLPILAEVAAAVGAAQIQNRGTLGGNVVNASPAGDMLPVLLATGASIVLRSVRGEREVVADDFWPAYRRTACAADELVVAVGFPLPPGRVVRFRKVGGRRAQAIGKTLVAAAWRLDDGVLRDVRIAAGSVAPTPVRAPAAEAVLEGARPDAEAADRAAAAIAAEIAPIDDVRSTAEYRRIATGRVLRRMVLDAADPRA
jgi:xanthine dehydrogenase iron-sulfur cluster and FAD-binding subunit A